MPSNWVSSVASLRLHLPALTGCFPLPCLLCALQVMSRELYDWLVREKIADGALISKWRKPGYEILCSLLAIQKGEGAAAAVLLVVHNCLAAAMHAAA